MTPEEIAKLPYRPCVGVMLVNAEGEVFVGQRRDRDQDAWQMPQGGVDKGEAARDAALRELEEETGYRAAVLEDMGCFWSSPGMVSESFTLVRARELTRVSEGGGVGGENITVHRVALSDIRDFIAAKRADGCGIDVRMLLLLGQGLLAGE